MIGVEELLRIISVALHTTRVKDEQPLSILLIASVGAGKSAALNKFTDSGTKEALKNGILYTTDITAFSLHKRHGKELKDGRIKAILMPDLLNALNKAQDQSDAFITFMNALIEEGIARVESARSNFYAEYPVRCSFLTAISKQDFANRREKWAAIGFLSRMLPISYSYSSTTVNQIFRSIVFREYLQDKPLHFELPETTYVELPVEFAAQAKIIAEQVKDPQDEFGFRRLKQLQAFLMGQALSQGRTLVTEDDLAELVRLKDFIGYNCSRKL